MSKEEEIKLGDTTCTWYPAPGTADKMCCGVCGTEMEVKRNCYGPTTMTEAMGQRKHKYDSFSCPHREEKWHLQVIELRREARKTHSLILRTLLKEEIKLILDTREPTIDVPQWPSL